jgi:hypothetical protein
MWDGNLPVRLCCSKCGLLRMQLTSTLHSKQENALLGLVTGAKEDAPLGLVTGAKRPAILCNFQLFLMHV